MSDTSVYISTSSFGSFSDEPLDMLRSRGVTVNLNSFGRKLTVEETVSSLRDVDALIAGTERLAADVLEQLPRLRVISRCGAGLSNVDMATAEQRQIKVYNTPDAPTQAVAELTVGLILDCLRHTSAMDRQLRAGTWKKRMGFLLTGKRVGIIGYGRIGRRVGELLQAFHCSVQFYDPAVEGSVGTMAELISNSDIITIHVPGDACLIGAAELESLPRGSWIINVARGGVVDEAALFSALQSGQCAGAALDVFDTEPYEGPLRELDNVILTPHIGSYAREARVTMEKQAVENVLKGLGL